MNKRDYDTLDGIEAGLRDLDGDWSDWAKRHRKWLYRRKRAVRINNARQIGTHTPLQWAELVVEFGGRCVSCCAEMEGELDKDHIIPIMLGGSDAIENIQPLCRNCNASKSLDTTNWVAIRRKHGWPFKGKKTA
jgi:5-methylcytosine-specific restriction endonuclease McrA